MESASEFRHQASEESFGRASTASSGDGADFFTFNNDQSMESDEAVTEVDAISRVSCQLCDNYMQVNSEKSSASSWMSPTVLLISVLVGGLLGFGLAELKVTADVTTLVAIPGNVFLSLLKCLVLPMVFVVLASGVANIVLMGKVSSIGLRTTALFMLFSTTASSIATMNALLLKGLHGSVAAKPRAVQPDVIGAMLCANNKYMEFASKNMTGSITCSLDTANVNLTALHRNNALGWVQVGHDVLKITGSMAAWSVFEQVQNILYQLIPNNIFDAFGNSILLSVITFSIAFGAAILSGTRQANNDQSMRHRKESQNGNPNVMQSTTNAMGESKLFELISELNQIFYFIVKRLFVLTPIAISSLMASSLSTQKNFSNTAQHVLVYVMTGLCSVFVHEILFLPMMFWIFTRKNPYAWLKKMVPCAAFAFACGSSLVTLPVTMRCVENSKEVSHGLMRFVLTLGCIVHTNGSAMFYPTTIVFLAATSGRDLHFGVSEIIVLILVGALSSIATPPIPNGQLILVVSVWSAVFPHEPLPDTFSYVVGIIWLEDRYETMCNVLGDTYVARIVAEYVDETTPE